MPRGRIYHKDTDGVIREIEDIEEGRRRRDEGIDRVSVSEAPWISIAKEAAWEAARRHDMVSSEDVWAILAEWGVPHPSEPRAMGAVMRWARSKDIGLLSEDIEDHASAKRPSRNGGDIRYYRSQIRQP